ncbi:winged helix-turn-helix domain-containing protein [Neobacillus sp. PS3-34]|uniref:ArsR/SmtB family transcription factor n=1 Tax=Neobacillus sp. PS3-34 TaxID=3070678 RepID=UPI0027DFF773|nr:winged helix-turn-helix domain-containing protein [Neobacillus sp. PS3-34]WML49034.1 winged helix-turn-helix domain-containing protein [Neobacillus sp. PS3-34]
MTWTIEVRFHPIFELLNSLRVFTQPAFYKKTEMGVNWRKTVLKQLSGNLADALNSEQLEQIGLLSEYLLTKPVSNLPLEQLLDELSDTTRKGVLEHFQNQMHVPKDYFSSAEGTFETSIDLLKQWKKEYYDQLDPGTLTSLEEDFLEKQQQITHYSPLDFVEKATNGFVLRGYDQVKKVILYPAYHSSPIVTYSHYPQLHIYGYPVDLNPSLEGEPSPSLMQRGIALSDKNRLRILRFLEKKERSFTDIVNFIGLAKSTVHHHMVLLRASGLVQVILSPTSSERYRLREQGLDNIFQNYHQYLFPSEV